MNRVTNMRPSGDSKIRRDNDRLLTENRALQVKLEKKEAEICAIRKLLDRKDQVLAVYQSVRSPGRRLAPSKKDYAVYTTVDIGAVSDQAAAHAHLLLRICLERALKEVFTLTSVRPEATVVLRQNQTERDRDRITIDVSDVTWSAPSGTTMTYYTSSPGTLTVYPNP